MAEPSPCPSGGWCPQLVVGLGNPGPRYATTRHNLGFLVAKPRCYMNESGRQVGPLAKFYSVPPADIVVIHDELDIDFGRIRLKFGGGVAGHNGLRSVGSSLGTNDFQRVRIGIGRPPGRMEGASFVLSNFTAAEWREVPTICEQAADATELLVVQGLEPAQNTVHAWG